MLSEAPKVSVIVASYCPGEGLNRVIGSLDAQTLPQEEFETIVVDDGSPDDTFPRLKGLAATRENMTVFRIENSGWPSRPRNIGIEQARGEYVLFMDHDDSLYPDGLRAAYEYARANNADLLSPKESKTNDRYWSLPALKDGNIPNALTDGGITRLLPMVPHKLYRRQLLLDHGIRFPEGPRLLWEDVYINVATWRHANVVSILADTPFYLWHASGTNSSHTFDPARADFWDRLEDVMKFISNTLDGPAYREARATALAHQVRVRVIDRLIQLLMQGGNGEANAMAFRRARLLLTRFTSDEVFERLPKKHQAQAYLLLAGQMGLVKAMHRADVAVKAETKVRAATWQENRLRLEVECRWSPKKPERPGLHRDGDRILRSVSPELKMALPVRVLDVTEDVASAQLDLCLRSRTGHPTWPLPFELRSASIDGQTDDNLSLLCRGEVVVDLTEGAAGQPIADDVWDLAVRSEWVGMVRKGPLYYDGAARPVLAHGRGAVAYSNTSSALSIDMVQRLRTFALDAKPRLGLAGPVRGFSLPLENVEVFGGGELDASMVVAIPENELGASPEQVVEPGLLEDLAARGALSGRVVADGEGARLEGGADLPAGRYVLFARREGNLHRTRTILAVAEDGEASFRSADEESSSTGPVPAGEMSAAQVAGAS